MEIRQNFGCIDSAMPLQAPTLYFSNVKFVFAYLSQEGKNSRLRSLYWGGTGYREGT